MRKISLFMLLACLSLYAQSQTLVSTFYYDTYHPNNSTYHEYYDPNGIILESCKEYRITIEGTYSIWVHTKWPNPCPSGEASPMYPTTGVTNGTVGFDPEYTFAIHSNCNMTATANTRISLNLDGSGAPVWFDPIHTGGYTTTHSYSYILSGKGSVLGIRQNSAQNDDDYGMLKVTIEEMPLELCNPDSISFTVEQEGCKVVIQENLPCHPDFQVLGVTYDMGDGNIIHNREPAHFYPTAGPYNVCATYWVTNGDSCCKVEYCILVESQGCDPCDEIQAAQISVNSANDPTFTFSENGIFGGKSSLLLGYLWDFGDGNQATGHTVDHTYATPGTYPVSLIVFYYNPQTGECCNFQVNTSVNVMNSPGPVAPPQQGSSSQPSNTIEESGQSSHTVMKVFPNPTSDELHISLKYDFIRNIKVLDLQGKMIYQTDQGAELEEATLNLSQLPTGTFLLQVETESGQIMSERIVIE